MLIIQSVEYTENFVLHKSHWYASGAHIPFKQIEQSVRKKNGSVFDRQLKGARRVATRGGKVARQKPGTGR